MLATLGLVAFFYPCPSIISSSFLGQDLPGTNHMRQQDTFPADTDQAVNAKFRGRGETMGRSLTGRERKCIPGGDGKGKNPKQGILGTLRRAGLHGRKGELVVGSGREEKLES